MDIQLSLAPADHNTLRSLRDWLRNEPELRGVVRILDKQPAPDEMGTIVDVLIIAVGSGGVLTVLAASLKSWFEQPRRANIHIKIRTEVGREIELTAEHVSKPEELVEKLLTHGDSK